MKSDNDLQRDVLAELTWEPKVQAQHIGVSVKDGVVTLTGDVPTYAEKFATENAARRVAGVRAIAEELKVVVENGWITLSGDVDWNFQREAAKEAIRHLMGVKNVTNLIKLNAQSVSTKDVRTKIEAALKRNMEKDAEGITIEANEGKIELRGKVHSWQERDDAGRAAWATLGVSAVENDLVVAF